LFNEINKHRGRHFGLPHALLRLNEDYQMQENTAIRVFRRLILPAMTTLTAWGQAPLPYPPPFPQAPRPGVVNYVEGQASIASVPLNPAAFAGRELGSDQTLTTEAGKVEILLTPGIFLRVADNSSLKMVCPDLANIEVQLNQGRAMIEVLDIRAANSIRIDQNGATTKLMKKGLYDFDADHNEVRVIKGSAEVTAASRHVKVEGEDNVTLGGAQLKSVHFDPKTIEDEFYRWCSLRSGYLSEASVDAGRVYMGTAPGSYGPGWYSFGWYWSPWFGVYTFLPADGIFWGPFGWGFYSPIAVFWSPYRYYGPYQHAFSNYHYPFGHGIPKPRGIGRR
jgi:hypothetical protein